MHTYTCRESRESTLLSDPTQEDQTQALRHQAPEGHPGNYPPEETLYSTDETNYVKKVQPLITNFTHLLTTGYQM